MNSFEALIADFSAKTGLNLVPDERGGCALETEGLFITIQHRPAADDIVVFAPVTDPDAPERPSKAVLEKALSLSHDGQYTAGATLGLFDGELILSVRLPMQGLDAESFAVKLAAFAEAAMSVQAEIAAAAAADGGNEGETGGKQPEPRHDQKPRREQDLLPLLHDRPDQGGEPLDALQVRHRRAERAPEGQQPRRCRPYDAVPAVRGFRRGRSQGRQVRNLVQYTIPIWIVIHQGFQFCIDEDEGKRITP